MYEECDFMGIQYVWVGSKASRARSFRIRVLTYEGVEDLGCFFAFPYMVAQTQCRSEEEEG